MTPLYIHTFLQAFLHAQLLVNAFLNKSDCHVNSPANLIGALLRISIACNVRNEYILIKRKSLSHFNRKTDNAIMS